ncbi:MAG: pantetheine-phosphate adenylyltransferase [Candidatus Eisenbacteria bacterium]|nr:pantetheine-phosphate adenylyltransferase [Candidatus Eisenbacteria bacterium]
MRTALFPGTFDPITEGHLDIIRRGLKIFDRVIVAVARGVHKETLFSLEERKELVEASLAEASPAEAEGAGPDWARDSVSVVEFDGLLVDLADRMSVDVIIRGLRFVSDFEYEFQLALMNRQLNRRVETMFLMPSARYSFLNASIVREVARLGGDVSSLVPKPVADRLKERYHPGRPS